METVDKLNIGLINSLRESIKDPFLVLDINGNILSFNKQAKFLFDLKLEPENIFDILDENSSQKFNEIVSESNTIQNASVKTINLSLRNNKTFISKVSVNIYSEGNSSYNFCTFKPEEQQFTFKDSANLNFKINDIEEIVKDEQLVDLINKAKTIYPFTYIGKEKFRAYTNIINDFFWIKDFKSRYIIVNDKFAQSLGLKAIQIEGKDAKQFLPPYFAQLYSSIDNYIIGSNNCTIFEGIPLQGLSDSVLQQFIQIPLTDSENNVVAIIGFSQKISIKTEFINERLLLNFPKAVVTLDNKGIIRNTSSEFCKLIRSEFEDCRNRNYAEVLPAEISEKIKYFIDSPIDNEEFDVISKFYKEKYPDGFHIFLNRIYENENQSTGVMLLMEEIKSSDDLEKIINSRGRMFEILIKNNPEPIFIYDTDNLRFLEVNDSALELYGYRKDEFLQMDLTDLYTPEDIQTLLDSSNSKTAEGKFSGPYRHKKKDGSSVFVEISKINFKYNDSDAHFNLVRDITDKLELEKKNQLFKAAFDTTEDLLFVTDAEGFITFINKPVASLLGYSKKDLDNVSFSTLVKNEERAIINTSIFQSHFKETVSLSMELKNNEEKFLEVELTATPVFDYKSDIDSFIIIGKYTREEQIKEVVKEVIKEVIVEKPVPAESSSEGSAFLSSLFHEILTPINVILGFVQELSESIDNKTAEQKEAVDIINQNRSNLLNTMNSIADFSSIQKKTAEVKIETIGITEIIDDLQNDLNEIADSRGIDFAYGRISSSLKFESDKNKFKKLSSLLLKIVTSVTREKKIYFSSYQLNEDSFALSVKDNYSVASKSLIDSLNMLFTNDENQLKKDFGVSKLSLRYAKALLALLNGKFEIFEKSSAKPDYGFVFPIKFSAQLPVVPFVIEPHATVEDINNYNTQEEALTDEHVESPDNETAGEVMQSEEEIHYEESFEEKDNTETIKNMVNRLSEKLDISQLSCLYIEDQIDSQILFKVQMKELKDIKFAVSFEDALPLLDNNHFDFIVMDINLQGEYNGLDALKIIHKMPEYETIPIIAVTAYVLPGDKEKFIATGFNDFISKPIFREKMIDSLEKIFLIQL